MSMREFCIIFDLVMAFIFFLIGIWFYKSNGKAANFLAGYNMKSAEERKKYDEKKMCKDYGKRMMERIEELKDLIRAYQSGEIAERDDRR